MKQKDRDLPTDSLVTHFHALSMSEYVAPMRTFVVKVSKKIIHFVYTFCG